MTSAIPKGPTYSKLPDKQPAIRSTGLSFAPHRAHLGSLNAADISFLLRFGCIGTNRCYESVVGVGGSEPLWLSPSIAWAPIFATRFRGRPDSGLEHPKANRLQVSLWCCRALVVTVALPKPHIALLARSGEEWKSCSSVGTVLLIQLYSLKEAHYPRCFLHCRSTHRASCPWWPATDWQLMM